MIRQVLLFNCKQQRHHNIFPYTPRGTCIPHHRKFCNGRKSVIWNSRFRIFVKCLANFHPGHAAKMQTNRALHEREAKKKNKVPTNEDKHDEKKTTSKKKGITSRQYLLSYTTLRRSFYFSTLTQRPSQRTQNWSNDDVTHKRSQPKGLIY